MKRRSNKAFQQTLDGSHRVIRTNEPNRKGQLSGSDLVAEYVSPDGGAKLVVFKRDCGATTSFGTRASLVTAVRWEGPKRLLLQHHAKVRAFKAERPLNA